MSSYTKGPWHVEFELDENRQKTDVINICHAGTECDMTTIANIYNIMATDEQRKSDAYLISFAPDMFEILKKLTAFKDMNQMNEVRAIIELVERKISNEQ